MHGVWVHFPHQLGIAIDATALVSGVVLKEGSGLTVHGLVGATFAGATSVATVSSVGEEREAASEAWVGWGAGAAQGAATAPRLPSPPDHQSDPRPCGAWPARHRRGSQILCRRSHVTGGCGSGQEAARRS